MLQHGVAVPFGDSEQDVITARVPVEVMLEAARRMTEPTPPADLGLAAALSENFLAENARSSSSGLHSRSVLERSAWQQAREEELGDEESPSSGLISAGALAAAAVPSGAGPAGVLVRRPLVAGVPAGASSTPAPPLVAQFGLQELIDEVPESRDWHVWARRHGLWLGVAVLALGLGASFAVRWLAPPAPSAVGHQGSQYGSQLVGQP